MAFLMQTCTQTQLILVVLSMVQGLAEVEELHIPAVLPIMSLHVHHGQYDDITVDNRLVPTPSYDLEKRSGQKGHTSWNVIGSDFSTCR